MHVLRVFDTVPLQCTEIVSIPQFDKQVVENCPVPVATGGTVLALEVGLDVSLDVVVVEKRIVDVDQKDNLVHWSYPYATLCNMLSVRA
jgi:hypothetical protein